MRKKLRYLRARYWTSPSESSCRLRAEIKNAKSENAQLLMQGDFAKK